MLTIGTQQWKAFTEAGLVQFGHEMVAHLRSFAPHADPVSTECLHGLVRLGIMRGRLYRFTDRAPLRLYLEIMLLLGSDFDTDPTLRRATRALRESRLGQHSRARALYEDVRDYCERVNGQLAEHLLAAIRRLRDVPYEALSGGGESHQRVLLLFRGSFPEKYVYAGEAALCQLATKAARKADEYGVHSEAGRLLITLLSYIFGHGAFTDPTHQWLAETMGDITASGPEQRIRELHRKTGPYLRAVMQTSSG